MWRGMPPREEKWDQFCYPSVFELTGPSKSLQVSRTFLSILAVLNNAITWMVSTRSPNSKSSSPFNSPLVTEPNAPITIGIIVTFMFHSCFFYYPSKTEVPVLLFPLNFILWSASIAKSSILQVPFFFVDYIKVWSSGRD